MIWLTWRQFRLQALVTSAALAAAAVVLAVTGLHATHVFDTLGVAGCQAHGDCGPLVSRFFAEVGSGTYQVLFDLSIGAILLLPAIIGIFWGAPLIARELESGTFRLAWNQSVTRDRWLATKLVAVGLASMAAAGLASLMASWWVTPLDRASALATGQASGVITNRFNFLLYATCGITPIGYAAFAFALGVLVGVVVRRTVPAMAITLAIFAAIQIAMPLWIRPHLISPVRYTAPVVASNIQGLTISQPGGPLSVMAGTPSLPGAWILSNQAVTASGSTSLGPAPAACQAKGPQGFQACANALAQLHLRQVVVYQPASRYWSFQWLETGIFLTVAILLAWGSFWWVRRRLS